MIETCGVVFNFRLWSQSFLRNKKTPAPLVNIKMLTNMDLSWNLETFQLASKLGCIPVEFDASSGRMLKTKKTWKIFIFRLWLLYLGFFDGWLAVRAISALKASDWELIPMTIVYALGFCILWFWSFFMFHTKPQLTVKFYNEFHQERSEPCLESI
jgi:hypothetical protein